MKYIKRLFVCIWFHKWQNIIGKDYQIRRHCWACETWDYLEYDEVDR